MKNYLKILLASFCLLLVLNCKNKTKTANAVTDEPKEEWVQLFNGKDLDDWIIKINGQKVNTDSLKTFRVENGVLKVSYDNYNNVFGTSYGHIFYKKPFSNYRLKLQYRFVGQQVADGQGWAEKNSGVMIHSQSPESMGLNQGFPVSLEVQFIGGVDESAERPTGNLCTPGTHVTMNDTLIIDHCINSSSKTFYGEEWVNMEVFVTDSSISHFINGKEVISYSNPIFGGEYLVDSSKKGKSINAGYIALQSESHPIEFKSIELLEINVLN